MSLHPRPDMTADEFVAWSQRQPREAGRFELVDGRVVTLQSERISHTRSKMRVGRALEQAVGTARAPCEVLVDGPLVRISPRRSFRPDGLLVCGEHLSADAIEVTAPLLVFEVLSPDSAERDHGEKVEGYFSLTSIAHYLIIDPDRRMIVHHRRGPGEDLLTRIRRSGTLTLDPPGLKLDLDDIFG